MEYNDDQLIFTKDIEKMANEYSQNLKSYGFVFLKTENLLDDEHMIELTSQVLYVLKTLKHITISKKAYVKFAELENSLNSTIDIVWTAVAAVDNKINARNRKVNLTVKGVDDHLQFRIASTSRVSIIESVGEEIIKDVDKDDVFIQNGYEAYNYQYRIGYVKGNDTYDSAGYDMWGKVLISTTNATTLRSVAK